jgi:hypothetical protein
LKVNTEKVVVLKKVKAILVDMLNQAKSAIVDAQTEANYHIGAMQSRYDTFKEEAQYLVAAQQIRVVDLEQKISQCDNLIIRLNNPNFKFNTIEMGAMFSVIDFNENRRRYFFIIPGGNGIVEAINNKPILCVSIDAPVIKAYVGLSENDYPDTDNEKDECIEFVI